MKTVVLKFGGTSVGSIDRIKKVCKIIEEVAYTGENTDGIITISNVDNVFNIGTKKKDSEAL